MIERVILDTGPLVAYLDHDEAHHEWCRRQLEAIRPPLLTCEAVLSEAAFLLRGQARAIARIEEFCVRRIIEVRFELSSNMTNVFGLMKKYADVPMSLADACLVGMAEQNPRGRVLTLDSDFAVYRLPNRRAIPVILPN